LRNRGSALHELQVDMKIRNGLEPKIAVFLERLEYGAIQLCRDLRITG
jgi:hypothetical protein